ncbi:MAG: hypothetical protein GWN84_04965 [Gammaproteobacteria bacterium]|nr:hypothetical protein [Gammaproteobacteria bacterium]NIR82324.1 hypothetical protein [Gammaproteobacteria bacterium]NIV76462.1 hypothetical protein [Gammaproteobacteria bacterium]
MRRTLSFISALFIVVLSGFAPGSAGDEDAGRGEPDLSGMWQAGQSIGGG